MARDSKRTLLIIDDEETFCIAVKDYLESDALMVMTAHTGAEGLAVCARMQIDIVLLDQRLPDGNGYDLVPSILGKNDQAKIIFITAYPSFENARQAVRAGAHDYLSKPLDLEELKTVVDSLLHTLDLEQVAQLHAYEQDRERRAAVLIGGGSGLAGIMPLMESASRSGAPVLITGETGTGKSLVAKMIHFQSTQSRAPFVSINCATLPENLVESELFGYERGAFTGAVSAKKGLFEMADGGTIFLDEIGEMPLQLQSKLLHVIDDGEVRRLGGTASRNVKVRVIAATNAELKSSLGRTFRKDLYYRLGVLQIHMPPLRERRQDIASLCDYLLKEFPGGKLLSIPDDEMARLTAYDWPGNIRELRNILERAFLMRHSGELRPSLLLDRPAEAAKPAFHPGETLPESTGITLDEAEKRAIADALRRHSGKLSRTAQALGTSLSTLKRRIKRYGLNRETGPY